MSDEPERPHESDDTETSEQEDDDPIEAMIEAGESLPGDLESRLVEAPPSTTEALLEVMNDDELAHGQAPGGGWAPAHAARILAARGDHEAIEPMVELLQTCEPGEALQPELVDALQSFGDAVLEPILEVLEAGDDRDVRSSMLQVATNVDVEDETLYRETLDYFHDDPEIGAGYLANYGDDRALEVLYEALDEAEVDTSGGMLANQSIIEMGEAIRELDGNPPEHLVEKMRLVKRKRRRSGGGLEQLIAEFGDEETQQPAEKDRDVGRNEPCWCGSGQKYKHCHWRDDRRNETRKKK